MTSRNLNTTWRDRIFKQYQEDYEADVEFPVRYLLSNPQWKKDLWYEIPRKIEPVTFKRAIFAFHKATRRSDNPEYEDEYIRVRPRKPYKPPETTETSETTETTKITEAPTTQELPCRGPTAEQHNVPAAADDGTTEPSSAGGAGS